MLRRLPRRAGRGSVDAASARTNAGVRAQLDAAPAHQRWPLLLEHVSEQASQVLGLDPSAILDPQQGLRDLGLDSLMALEIRNRLQRSLGQSLRSTLAFDYPTIDAVARHLATDVLALDIGGRVAAKADNGAIHSLAIEADDLLMQIEQLSDEQAEQLLATGGSESSVGR